MANISFQDTNPTISKIKSNNNYYDIKDAAARLAIQNLIDQGIGNGKIECQIVPSLPNASADTKGKIYLIPASGGAGTDVKEEYITIYENSVYKWEKIGTTQVQGEIPVQLSGSYTPEGTINTPNIAISGGGLKYFNVTEISAGSGTESINSMTTNISGETLEFSVEQKNVPSAASSKVRILTDTAQSDFGPGTTSVGVLTELPNATSDSITFRGTPATIIVK